MITFALFLSITAAILYVMTLPHGMAGSAGVFSTPREQSFSARSEDFRKFCDGNCRFRHICYFKENGWRNSTCYEYELNKHALW